MKLSETEIEKALTELPQWKYTEGFLKTEIVCKDFKAAFALMTRISFEAEALNHHPNWENVYNRIAIALQTHDAGGITSADIELAKRINALRGSI